MRKGLFLLIVLASLAAVAAARGGSVVAPGPTVVKITHTGYVPTSVSVPVGGEVAFANSDTVAHTVDFNTTAGMSCSTAVPLVVQPAQSVSCTFSSVGKFDFSDPNDKSKAFRGTILVVKTTSAVSLAVTPAVVVYGRKVTLAGVLANHQSGQSLQVLSQKCGESAPTPLATANTTTGGAYSYQTQPLEESTYSVKFKSSTSSAVTVKVRPRLRLGKTASRHYALRVFAAESFAGKYASFQRYRAALTRWVTVRRVLLRANPTGVAPTAVSSAGFHAKVRAGLRVRAVLGQTQVGSCYLAGWSNTIRS